MKSANNYESFFYKAVAVSISAHLIFLFVISYGALLPSKEINYQPFYAVKLVSVEESRNTSAQENVPAVTQNNVVPPKKISAKEMILPIEKKHAPSQKDLLSAINKINSELQREKLLNVLKDYNGNKKEEQKGGKSSSLSPNSAKGSGVPSGSVAEQYYSLVWDKIQNAWILPSGMAALSYGLETIVSITINKDGKVSNIKIEKSSGNSYFDQTAIRAINKVNPLPQLPPSWLQNSINIGIKFSCKEGCQ